MAYSYFPATYPYGGYYSPIPQQIPQQQMPQQIPQQPQQQTPSGIIWISGISEAQMYPVAPNNAVALWENSGKTIYLKQADATGKPTMRVYDLVERAQNAQESGVTEDGKIPTYATKDELGAVVGAVRGIDDALSSLRANIDTIKGDMYGIAGKKKPTRKEVTDAE